ncbi:E3 SUMO-protein ligase NSE2 [Synchiropus splendidus]|uniref:E3 SUMO-protein ligase NSE2 n=1 Tax=Synchiropus splendidus TaxID=270530 RepID=UPI00237DE57B|nr:E3 SUMO-protein ligase NSE2 [Synchiropus splendidus]
MCLSSVHAALTDLKSLQADIGTGMDLLTEVAVDLVEAKVANVDSELKKLEAMILECAQFDSEINNYVDVVHQVTTEASSQEPDMMLHLVDAVNEQLAATATLSDHSLPSHPKVVAFKESVRGAGSQDSQQLEELDQDLAITHSQVNFKCPLTQVDMENPVKNQKCSHRYDEAAILNLIRKRHSQKKKCRCPIVGCGNLDVKESDLIPDVVLRRRIQSEKNSR